MKTQLDSYRGQRGYVLVLTLVFVGLGVLLLTTLMNWTAETSHLTDRNNQYYITAAAAEAATEKVLVHFSRDYINDGEATVYANLAKLQRHGSDLRAENPYWANFTFTNPQNGAAGVYVDRYATNQYVVLNNQYQGLYGYQSTYRIIANAALSGTLNANLIAAVRAIRRPGIHTPFPVRHLLQRGLGDESQPGHGGDWPRACEWQHVLPPLHLPDVFQ